MPVFAPAVRTAPSYALRFADVPLPDDLAFRLQSWSYEDVERVDKLSLVFDNLDGAITDREEFEAGIPVEFRHGYAGELAPPRFFTVAMPKGWQERKIGCLGVTRLINSANRMRKWEDSTLTAVVEQIADDHGLEPETQEREDANGNELEFTYLQANVGDLSFLVTLGYKIGYAMWIEDGTLHFLPRKYGQKPTLEFVYRGTEGVVMGFEPEEHVVNKKGRFKTGGVDLQEKGTFFIEQAGETTRSYFLGKKFYDGEKIERNWDEATQGTWIEKPMGTKAEAEDLMQGRWINEMDDQITATLTVIGEPRLVARRTIVVSNVQKYSGLYYVESVNHSGDAGGYVSKAKLTRNATFDAGAKYSRENVDTVVNDNRETVGEFLTRTKNDGRYDVYRRLLDMRA